MAVRGVQGFKTTDGTYYDSLVDAITHETLRVIGWPYGFDDTCLPADDLKASAHPYVVKAVQNAIIIAQSLLKEAK